MLIGLLILTRAVHIAASMLITGNFTFYVVVLGFSGLPVSHGLRELKRSFVRLAVWTLVAALVFAVLWFCLEVVNVTGLSFWTLSLPEHGRSCCLKQYSVMTGSFVSALW